MFTDRVWFWWKYDSSQFWRYGLWERLARKLPKKLIYAAMIRAWSGACPGDRHPEEISPSAIAEYWQTKAKV